MSEAGLHEGGADLVVLGGVVVAMDPPRTILPRGAVAVRGDRIVAVGPRDEIAQAYPAPCVIEAEGDLVMPGLVDGHTHVAMTLFRGLADDLPLATWLDRARPAEHRALPRARVQRGGHQGGHHDDAVRHGGAQRHEPLPPLPRGAATRAPSGSARRGARAGLQRDARPPRRVHREHLEDLPEVHDWVWSE